MYKSSAWAAFIAMLALLCACSGGDSSPTEPGGPGSTVPLGQEYALRVGERVRLEGTSLEVVLLRVFSDSRCPIDVTCPAAGTVDLELQVTQAQRESFSEVIRFTGTGGQQDRVTFFGYRFVVQRVLPARRQGEQIPQLEYRVFLISSVDR